MPQLNLYSRPDGATGAGFQIRHAAKWMHSVAWPDRPAERFLDDELSRLGIVVTPHSQMDASPAERTASVPEAPPVASELQTVSDTAAPELAVDESPAAIEPDPVETEPRSFDEVETQEPTSGEPEAEAEAEQADEPELSEAEAIRQYLGDHPTAGNKEVIEALAKQGVEVQSSQVSRQRKKLKG